MKSLELIYCLQAEESKALQKELKKHRRTALLPLFNQLKKAAKKQQEPTNEELFGFISDRPYDKKMDYLLRNELRLLNGEIETFLLSNELLKRLKSGRLLEISQNLLWLELLLERQQFALFEKEWRKILRQAKENKHFSLLSQLHSLYFEYLRHYKEIEPARYRKARSILDEAKSWTLKAAMEQLRKLELNRAYVDRVIFAFDPTHTRQPPSQQFASIETEADPLFDYLYLWAKTYIENNNTDIYLKLLQLHPEIVKIRPEFKGKDMVFYTNLALQEMLQQNYEQASLFYKEALRIDQQNGIKTNVELLFNYCSNLCKMHEFDQAIQLWKDNRVDIEEQPTVRYRYRYLIAMCYLF